MTDAISQTRVRMRTALITLLVAICCIVGGGVAHAYWSASHTHVGTSTAGALLPAPDSITCRNQSIVLIAVAEISWTAVTDASGYRVTVTRASGGATFTTHLDGEDNTSIDLSTGVLGDLLTGLLAPTLLTVTVTPYLDAGSGGRWLGPDSVSSTASARLLPIGTLCA